MKGASHKAQGDLIESSSQESGTRSIKKIRFGFYLANTEFWLLWDDFNVLP